MLILSAGSGVVNGQNKLVDCPSIASTFVTETRKFQIMCKCYINLNEYLIWFPITLTETLLKWLKLISSNKHGHKKQKKQEV